MFTYSVCYWITLSTVNTPAKYCPQFDAKFHFRDLTKNAFRASNLATLTDPVFERPEFFSVLPKLCCYLGCSECLEIERFDVLSSDYDI